MTDIVTPTQADMIDRMTSRFLAWKLPEGFNPDAGISFKAHYNEHTGHPMRHEPTGTNLFSYAQAREMVRAMVASEATQAAEIARLRELVARLYCASGCSCCRDGETWEKASNELGELLNIPKYDDGSGYDFYSVRDAALSARPSEQEGGE